jgi:hypothetical protein
MRGRFANLRVVRRAQREDDDVKLRSAIYAAQPPVRSTPWPLNDAGPSWASVRPRQGAIGHQHLRTLLRVHGMLHRSGVRAAVTALTMRTIADGVVACWYFDLAEVAERWARIPQVISSVPEADRFDAEYREHVADGHGMAEAIRRKIAARPQDFPVGPI